MKLVSQLSLSSDRFVPVVVLSEAVLEQMFWGSKPKCRIHIHISQFDSYLGVVCLNSHWSVLQTMIYLILVVIWLKQNSVWCINLPNQNNNRNNSMCQFKCFRKIKEDTADCLHPMSWHICLLSLDIDVVFEGEGRKGCWIVFYA